MTSSLKSRNLLIVGLGLLGASLGLALRGSGLHRLGWARRAATRDAAMELDVVDETAEELEALLARADLVVLAMPIPAIIAFLPRYRMNFKPGAVVTDIGSTKSEIMAAAEAAFCDTDIRFTGSHPMAGTEKSGIGAAFAELYNDADVFIVSGGDAAADAEVTAFWENIGANPVPISALEHDDLVAHTSHVPHILAAALTRSVLNSCAPEEKQRRFQGCATGFRDTSRIASSNPVMWREIIEHNRPAVLAAMRDFDRYYEEFRRRIASGDFDGFEADFADGKHLRDEWMQYKYGKKSK